MIAGGLGLREAFRFRLLISSAAKSTTLLSAAGVLVWVALVISAFFVLPIAQALIVMIVPFVIGNLIRLGANRLSGGNDFLSPERSAELEHERRVAVDVAAQAVSAEHLAQVVSRFNLTPQDLELLYDRLKRQGLTSPEALSAMTRPDVVQFYFDKIGREDHCTLETSMELTLIARKELA